MKSILNQTFILLALIISSSSWAQNNSTEKQKVIRITGARFTYPLVQKWIDDYSEVNNNVQIVIESRSTMDPAQYDILIEAYEQSDEVKKNREYVYIARYAILTVANSKSAFAETYKEKGINKNLINQLFFYNVFADKENEQKIKSPYTIYTRLQKAGAPTVFANYFGYEQKNINGKSIAGSDEHLLKALLRDSTGVSYLPLPLAYDRISGKPVSGLTILPVDFDGNGRVNDDEKFYDELSTVIQRLESTAVKDIHNIPEAYIHFSVDKHTASIEAIEFLKWVIHNSQKDLESFGYLKPEKEKVEQFVSKHTQ